MMFIQKKKIILASNSPRRKDYLSRYKLDFKVKTGHLIEEPWQNESPSDFAERMALEKNQAVHKIAKNDEIIISADTIVVFENKIIGKPLNFENKMEMLSKLNGQTHEVITAYVVFDVDNNEYLKNKSISKVSFNKVSNKFLNSYALSDESNDKAGSYSIQGVGTFLVKSIEGSYNNVVGLPIEILLNDLINHNFIEIA